MVSTPDFTLVATGPGPVRPLGGDASGVADLISGTHEPGWLAFKTLWISDPSYQGPFLVRIRRLDGDGPASVTEDPRVTSFLVPPGPTASGTQGYREVPGATWVKSAGCVAWQVDGLTFSHVIVIRARCRPPYCTPPPTSTTTEPSPSTDPLAALRRPLRLPTVAPGQKCPVTLTRHRPDASLGFVQGAGPAGPVGLDPGSILHYVAPTAGGAATDLTWGVQKVLWAVDSHVGGTVLVRGHQLAGPHQVRFNDPAVGELVLLPKAPITPGGWRDYPGYTRLQAAGCYAYQVDAASGTTIIVFQAEGPTVGS